ncbi:MAG: hypothetical protein ABWX74_11785 [Aeromicrobium sp.]
MSGPAVAGIEGRLAYTIAVPGSWFELDLEPATREASIRRLVEERVRGNGAMWEQRHAIQKVLVEQARAAHESGATYCATFSIPTDEGPITGTVTVSLLMDPADDETSALQDVFRSVPRVSDELEPWTEVGVVDVGGVDCPRSKGIEDVPIGDGHFVRNVSMLTAVPVPDHRRMFLIACSSPVIAMDEQLLDLFDAVTGTFRVVRLDERRTP